MIEDGIWRVKDVNKVEMI